MVDGWIGVMACGLVEWKLAAWGTEGCKSPLARATAMGRRIISVTIARIMIIYQKMTIVVIVFMIVLIFLLYGSVAS